MTSTDSHQPSLQTMVTIAEGFYSFLKDHDIPPVEAFYIINVLLVILWQRTCRQDADPKEFFDPFYSELLTNISFNEGYQKKHLQ